MSWTLSFQFEYHDASIVARSEQIDLWVGGNDPESIVITRERLNRSALVQVPYPDGFIFADGEDEILVGMEYTCRGILKVATTCIDFPGLGICTKISKRLLIYLQITSYEPLILHSLTSRSSPAETILVYFISHLK